MLRAVPLVRQPLWIGAASDLLAHHASDAAGVGGREEKS